MGLLFTGLMLLFVLAFAALNGYFSSDDADTPGERASSRRR
ncbi:MAG TPA: hypothetical protein VI485_20825 [Vicinamibacterales bacterium]|nr:hypothetical protein [Vicinamibacterales bacterium]